MDKHQTENPAGKAIHHFKVVGLLASANVSDLGGSSAGETRQLGRFAEAGVFTGAPSGNGCSMTDDWHNIDWFLADDSCPLWIQRAGHIMRQDQRLKALRKLKRNRLMAGTSAL